MLPFLILPASRQQITQQFTTIDPPATHVDKSGNQGILARVSRHQHLGTEKW